MLLQCNNNVIIQVLLLLSFQLHHIIDELGFLQIWGIEPIFVKYHVYTILGLNGIQKMHVYTDKKMCEIISIDISPDLKVCHIET